MASTEESLTTEIRRLAAQRKRKLAEVDDVTEKLAAAVVELAKLELAPETRLAELAGVSRNTIRTWVGKSDWSELWANRREGGQGG